MELAFAGPASAVRADARTARAAARLRSATRCARAFGLAPGRGAGSLPRRAGRARPAGRGGRGAAAAVRRRRRAVARPGARRRRSRSSRGGSQAESVGVAVRRARSERRTDELAGAAGAGRRRPARRRRARAAGLGDPGTARRARARPDRGRDARQPARAAGAAARLSRRPSWPAASGCRARSPLSGRIEQSFRAPAGAAARRRRAAAAARRGRAGRRSDAAAGARPSGSGSGPTRRLPAEAAGLIELGARVRFRHPLVRSAVYARGVARGAAARAPRAGRGDRSRASIPIAARGTARRRRRGPDEDVAAELERSAGRAQARGGLAAAAAFLERAAQLTPDPARRAGARAGGGAGEARRRRARRGARARWPTREAGPLDELQRAPRRAAARARSRSPSSRQRAPPLLLDAAERLEPLDVRARARDLPGRALRGDCSPAAGERRAERCATWRGPRAAAPPPPRAARAGDLLLDGLALLVTEGYAAAAPALRRALRAFAATRTIAEERPALAAGSPAASPRRCGTTRAGTRSPPATSSWPATPGRSPCCRSRSHAPGACRSTPATWPRPRRWSRRPSAVTRGDRRAARAVRSRCCSPPARAARPRPRALIERGRAATRCHAARAWCVTLGWATRAALQRPRPLRGGAARRARRPSEHAAELGITPWVLPELVEAAVAERRARASLPTRCDGWRR